MSIKQKITEYVVCDICGGVEELNDFQENGSVRIGFVKSHEEDGDCTIHPVRAEVDVCYSCCASEKRAGGAMISALIEAFCKP